MQSIIVQTPGAPDHLALVESPVPEPGPGQVRVRVHAAGVNYADVLQRRGTYPAPLDFPLRLGGEVAGVVDAVGSGVEAVEVGARVAAMTENGGYAEFALARQIHVVPIPEHVPFAEATALLVQGMTAASLCETIGSVRGRRVFVTAAAGGVGVLLVQLLSAAGAEVVAGVGSEPKAATARSFGASDAVRYTESGWAEVLKAEQDPFDVIVDAVGGNVYRDALRLLASGGTIFVYGASSGELVGLPPELLGPVIFGNQRFVGHALPSWLAADPSRLPRTSAALFEAYIEGRLRVLLHPPFALSDAAEAHRTVEARRTSGKVVLQPALAGGAS